MKVIYPVIMAVPGSVRALSAPARVAALSQAARQAARISADRQGLALGALSKNAAGAPQPSNGLYWSISHKPDYVAGVVADAPIGLDLERIRPVHAGLKDRIADADEWELYSGDTPISFFRTWTAKEAVLKAVGKGLSGLSSCRLQRVLSHTLVELCYKQQSVMVEHFYFEDHVAAVVKTTSVTHWVLMPAV